MSIATVAYVLFQMLAEHHLMCLSAGLTHVGVVQHYGSVTITLTS